MEDVMAEKSAKDSRQEKVVEPEIQKQQCFGLP